MKKISTARIDLVAQTLPLIEHAFASGRVRRITAHTTEANSGSVRVLVKAGFGQSGAMMEGGVVEFVLDGPQRHAPPESVRR